MRRQYVFLTLLVFLAIWVLARPGRAQSPCPHVDFRLDTTLSVDREAVCTAAKAWAERGIEIFVYLTDESFASEAEWFEQLDRVEAEAGIVGTGQEDSFNRNTLAFEASTASNTPWAYTLTYGERLFDTNLDEDDAAVDQITTDMRNAIQSENGTGAFVQAIEQAYQVNYPPPSPLLIGGIGVVVLVVLAVASFIVYVVAIRPALARARRRRQMEAHLATLQKNVANLLLASERLLKGETTEESVLYQLFEAYGGRHYPDRDEAVREWIRRSRAALNDAYDLRRSLQDESVVQRQSLEELIRNWEMIYLTLVGSSPRIRELTDAELQDLLNPMIILERKAADVQLAAQLDEIRRQIQGMPLKVTLQEVDAEKTDQEGILGYVDQVERQIAELMAAQEEAPGQLEEARRERLEAEEDIASARPFGMTGSQMFAGIDARLTRAERDLANGVYLRVIETADATLRDLDILDFMVEVAARHAERTEKVEGIRQQGYRPPQLEALNQEIDVDIEHVVEHVTEGEYLAADEWIDEVDVDSQRAVDSAESWQALHEFNENALAQAREKVARLQIYLEKEAMPAWKALQAYPPENWQDVTNGPRGPTRILQAVGDERLPQIARRNSLEVQELAEAEQLMVAVEAELTQAHRHLEALVNRLAEIRTAEANIAEGIRLAQANLDRAIALRDAEDVKIGPEIDRQVAEAGQLLGQAVQLAAERHFIGAVHAQTAARRLADEAYASASEQVQKINELQDEVEKADHQASASVDESVAQAEKLPAQIKTETTGEMVRALMLRLSEAKQERSATISLEDHALATALASVVATFVGVGELAGKTQARVAEDLSSYNRMRDEAQAQIHQAQLAMAHAEPKVNHVDAGHAGQQAWLRARDTLPSKQATVDATREALAQLKQAATLAYDYAREAEQKAEQAIRYTQQRRRQWTIFIPPSRPGWPDAPRSGGWSFPSGRPSWRTPSRSTGRTSSGSASRRSSSSGSFHRSRAGGSMRRSRSSGAARRSRSGGGRRRR